MTSATYTVTFVIPVDTERGNFLTDKLLWSGKDDTGKCIVTNTALLGNIARVLAHRVERRYVKSNRVTGTLSIGETSVTMTFENAGYTFTDKSGDVFVEDSYPYSFVTKNDDGSVIVRTGYPCKLMRYLREQGSLEVVGMEGTCEFGMHMVVPEVRVAGTGGADTSTADAGNDGDDGDDSEEEMDINIGIFDDGDDDY